MPVKLAFNKLLVGIVLSAFVLVLTAQQISAQCNTPYFKNSTRKVITNASVSATQIADFNGDGKPDVGGLDAANGNFVVLLNDGAGSFGNPATTFVGIAPTSFFVWDLNGDGKKDLVVRRNTNPVSVTTFTGNGNGSFTQWNTTTFNQFGSFDNQKIVRFDNDPRPEILAGSFYYPINSDGTLAPGNPINTFAAGDIIGDFNGDGKTDFVKQGQNLTLYVNTGNAAFSASTLATDPLQPATAADLNGDSKDDLVAIDNIDSFNSRLEIFLSSPSGTFTRLITSVVTGNRFSYTVKIGDFNGDGVKDIINIRANFYDVYLGNGNGIFTLTTVNKRFYNYYFFASLPQTDLPNFIFPSADFDGDGRDDFIATAPSYYFPTTAFIIRKNVCTPPKQPGVFDYDGDGSTDLTLWRASDQSFSSYNLFLSTSTRINFSGTGQIPTPGDFDGDGKTDLAVWNNTIGTWYIRRSSDLIIHPVAFGTTGDKPVQGDYDGDGVMDLAVYRPSNGVWYLRNLANGSFYQLQFGIAEDKPVPADYDGDGKTDIAVYRPSTGIWYLIRSSDNQFYARQFGIAEDKPTPGDYDGDGKADIAVFRPSTGTWYLTSSVTGGYVGFPFGISSDLPAPVSVYNDSTQVAVYRPSQGRWYVNLGNAYDEINFGGADEIPVSSLPRIE